MPKWVVTKALKELDRIDKLHEHGIIDKAKHDELSKKAVEKALSLEKRTSIKGKI